MLTDEGGRMTTSQPSPSAAQTGGPLADALVALAQSPDDVSGIDAQLARIAQLATDRVVGVDYASVTALRGKEYVTVAASSDLAKAVDDAQYADDDGPCLRSLDIEAPVTVSEIATTMTWPGFHQTAAELGLHASVSIPLAAGSGTIIAVLNLYGRDAAAMAPLIGGVWAVFDPDRPLPDGTGDLPALDAGGEELLAGFAEALSVRSTIQLALGILMGHTRGTAEDAYVQLRLHAAAAGTSLLAAAATVVQEGFTGSG
jgi:hypothetical protein